LFIAVSSGGDKAAAESAASLALLGATLPEVSEEAGVLYTSQMLTASLSTTDLELLIEYVSLNSRRVFLRAVVCSISQRFAVFRSVSQRFVHERGPALNWHTGSVNAG
jgi:hypothetical protein